MRPLNKLEMTQGGQCCVQMLSQKVSININDTHESHDFTFDRVFNSDTPQQDVFEEVALPILESVMSGYNGTIFAYGQTSSGKTYTMEGYGNDIGIIPRVMEQIFKIILDAPEDDEFQIKVSMLEIYNEKVNDLLDSDKVNLQIKEDKLRGIFVHNVTEVFVCSAENMLAVMKKGTSNRSVAATRMNENSSRSHSLFLVNVLQKNLKTETKKQSKLYFVDLAGSEKIAKTNVQGQQLEEAKNINKSLTCLGMVINALTADKKEHIPYRDSKLTRILQEALGGNSKTTLIIACSMCSYNDRETLSTLRFGQRAKAIKNKAVINQERSAKELTMMLELAEKRLQQQNEIIRNLQSGVYGEVQSEVSVPQTSTKQQSLRLMQQHMQILNQQEQIEQIRAQYSVYEMQITALNATNEELKQKLTKQEDILLQMQQTNQQLQLQMEREKFILSDFDIRFNGMKSHMKEIKDDLGFMLVSFQLKKVNYIRAKEDETAIQFYLTQQQEFENKLSFSINKLLNSIDDVQEFLKDKGSRVDIKGISGRSQTKDSNSKVNEVSSILTDDEENVSSFRIPSNTDIVDEPDVQKVLYLIANKVLDDDNMLFISEFISKQSKTVQILSIKSIECQQNLDNLKSKYELRDQKQQLKLQDLQERLQIQTSNLKKQQDLYVLQLQDKATELAQVRKKAEIDNKQRQTDVMILKTQMNELERNLTVTQPAKKILELDQKLKQLTQERQKVENADKEMKCKNKDITDLKLAVKQLQMQLTQQQTMNSQLLERQYNMQQGGQIYYQPQQQIPTYQGLSQVLGLNEIAIKGGGGNARKFQQQQQMAQFDMNMSVCSNAFDPVIRPSEKPTPRVHDFDNSFYGKTLEDFQDILSTQNRGAAERFDQLPNKQRVQQLGMNYIFKQNLQFK